MKIISFFVKKRIIVCLKEIKNKSSICIYDTFTFAKAKV